MNRTTIIRLGIAAGLTDEQIKAIDVKTLGSLHFARAIEAATLKAHQQAIEAAVLAERKACAEIAVNLYKPGRNMSDYDSGYNWGTENVQQLILARTQNMRTLDAHKE